MKYAVDAVESVISKEFWDVLVLDTIVIVFGGGKISVISCNLKSFLSTEVSSSMSITHGKAVYMGN